MTRTEFDALMADASPSVKSSARTALKESYEDRTPSKIQNAQPLKLPVKLESGSDRKAPCSGRPHVSFLLRRVKLLDVDAKWGSVKNLLDGLAIAQTIPGDREDQITLEVTQEMVPHYADEETIIEIETP